MLTIEELTDLLDGAPPSLTDIQVLDIRKLSTIDRMLVLGYLEQEDYRHQETMGYLSENTFELPYYLHHADLILLDHEHKTLFLDGETRLPEDADYVQTVEIDSVSVRIAVGPPKPLQAPKTITVDGHTYQRIN